MVLTNKAPTPKGPEIAENPTGEVKLQSFEDNTEMKALLDKRYAIDKRPAWSEKVLQNLYETPWIGPDFLERAAKPGMLNTFDDLIAIHSELTALGVFAKKAFEEQFILTEDETTELLATIETARYTSTDSVMLIQDFFASQENETVTMDEMYTGINTLKDSEWRNEAFDQIQDVTYLQLKEKFLVTGVSTIDEDTIHNMSVALTGRYIGKVNTLADKEIIPTAKGGFSITGGKWWTLDKQELIDIARTWPFGPDAHDVMDATDGTWMLWFRLWKFIWEIQQLSKSNTLSERANLKDPTQFLQLLKTHVDKKTPLWTDIDAVFWSEVAENENYDEKVEKWMSKMTLDDKKVISELVENYSQAKSGSFMDRFQWIKATIATYTGMFKSIMSEFKWPLLEIMDMFWLDKNSWLFQFLSKVDEIDASLKWALKGHEVKVLWWFSGLKLKGGGVDIKKSLIAQDKTIDHVSLEWVEDMELFNSPRKYTKSLWRSTVRKLYKDAPKVIKNLPWPRCISDISIYNAMYAKHGEETPALFADRMKSNRCKDDETEKIFYKKDVVATILNDYKDATYTTLSTRFNAEKMTVSQLQNSMIHGLIKWPAASEYVAWQSKVWEKWTVAPETVKTYTLDEKKAWVTAISGIKDFLWTDETFTYDEPTDKYKYIFKAWKWLSEPQPLVVEPNGLLWLTPDAQKTYLHEQRTIQQNKFNDKKWWYLEAKIAEDFEDELDGKVLTYIAEETSTGADDADKFKLTDPLDASFTPITIPGKELYGKSTVERKKWIKDSVK